LAEPSGIHVRQLFDESDIDAYDQRARATFEAVLASTRWVVSDILAVARPFELLVIARQGVIECRELGGFKKKIAVGELLPWNDVVTVEPTEPTLRVYGIEIKDARGLLRTYTWSGGGSQQDRKERDRIYRIVTAVTGS
jgi:hypothetical protein